MATTTNVRRGRSDRCRGLLLVAATAVWVLLAAPAITAVADPTTGPAAPVTTAPPVPTPSVSPTTPTGVAPTPPTSAPEPSLDIPDPTTDQSPSTAPADQHPSGDDGIDDHQRCGITHIPGCVNNVINGFFKKAVSSALNPLLGLLSTTLLTTPNPDSLPQVRELWSNSWQILLASYGLLVLIAGIVVMAYETVQTRYSIKEIAPRIVVGFLAGALSMTVATTAIRLANALAEAVGGGLDPASAGSTLSNIVLKPINHSLFSLFLGLFLAGMLTALMITWVVRVSLTVILIAGAPIALMWHALPQTEGIAHWWWKAFGGCLAIQVVQSLTLTAAMRVFLAPDGFASEFPTDSRDLVNLIVSVALMLILYKIPFWMLAPLRVGKGRSFVGSMARGFVAYKVAGALGLRGGRHPSGGARRKRHPSGTGGTTQPTAPNPYAGTRVNAKGQYMLPLPGLKRVPRPVMPRPANPAARPRGSGAGQQLTLPFGNPTSPNPYARTRVNAHGQYMLPLPGVRRVTPPPTAHPTAAPHPPSLGRRGRQLSLPLGDDWPENKPVLQRDGQYRLPIDVTRVPRPTPPPPPPPPAQPRPRGKQLELPFQEDPYRGNRALRSGQYPLPLDVQRVAPTKPTPPPPAPPVTPTTRGRQLRLPLPPPTTPTKPASPAGGGK